MRRQMMGKIEKKEGAAPHLLIRRPRGSIGADGIWGDLPPPWGKTYGTPSLHQLRYGR